eukprot:724785-Amorphochlora_amoeboformis.AAC.1
MTNVFYVKGKKGRKVIWKYQFDLKGCRDDKLLRINGRKITVGDAFHPAAFDTDCEPVCCIRRFTSGGICFTTAGLGAMIACVPVAARRTGASENTEYMAGKSMAYDGKLPLSKKQKEIFSE